MLPWPYLAMCCLYFTGENKSLLLSGIICWLHFFPRPWMLTGKKKRMSDYKLPSSARKTKRSIFLTHFGLGELRKLLSTLSFHVRGEIRTCSFLSGVINFLLAKCWRELVEAAGLNGSRPDRKRYGGELCQCSDFLGPRFRGTIMNYGLSFKYPVSPPTPPQYLDAGL